MNDHHVYIELVTNTSCMLSQSCGGLGGKATPTKGPRDFRMATCSVQLAVSTERSSWPITKYRRHSVVDHNCNCLKPNLKSNCRNHQTNSRKAFTQIHCFSMFIPSHWGNGTCYGLGSTLCLKSKLLQQKVCCTSTRQPRSRNTCCPETHQASSGTLLF